MKTEKIPQKQKIGAFSPSHQIQKEKIRILIASYMCRLQLSPNLQKDIELILKDAPRLIDTMIRLSISNQWILTTAELIRLSQRVILIQYNVKICVIFFGGGE